MQIPLREDCGTMQNRLADTDVSAGIFARAAAFIIDCLVVGFVVSFIRTTVFFVRLAIGVELPDLLFNYDIIDIVCYIISAAYFALFTGLTGSTLGKKAMKLQVIKEDGSRLGFFDALYRETVGRYLTSILFIGYIVAACDTKKRGFHDMLSGTRVVYALPKQRERYIPQDGPEAQQY